jgi:heterotetrameric sarcosine oxidase gamma subunit
VADESEYAIRSGRLLSLRAQPARWLDELAGGLSELPVCRQMFAGSALWLRLGPDEWWSWCEGADDDTGTAQAAMQAITRAAGPAHHACVDLSDAYCALWVRSPAADLLSQGCDLDFARLAANFAGRTRLSAYTVVLAPSRTEPGAMRLWADASLAESLQAWLARAAVLQGASCAAPGVPPGS